MSHIRIHKVRVVHATCSDEEFEKLCDSVIDVERSKGLGVVAVDVSCEPIMTAGLPSTYSYTAVFKFQYIHTM